MAKRPKLPKGYYWRGRKIWCRTDPITKGEESTGLTDPSGIKAWRAERDRLASDPRYAAASKATLGEWYAATIEFKSRKSSADTIEFYTQKLGHFRRIWGDSLPMVEITPTLCDAYVEKRRSEGVTDHTIVKEFSCLMQLLKLARRAGKYPHQIEALKPTDLFPNYVPRSRKLNLDEIVALRSACLPRLNAFVSVAVCTGGCRSEVLKFDPATDLDRSTWTVHLRGTKRKDRNRHIPVLKLFQPILEEVLDMLPIRSYANNLIRDLEMACKRAGIVRCTPNDLRRTFCSILKSAGVDKDTCRRMMGHSTSRMVDEVYGVIEPEDLAKLAEPYLTDLQFPSSPEPVAVPKLSKTGQSYWSRRYNKRDSGAEANAETSKNLGANSEGRTPDLRFTNPVTGEPPHADLAHESAEKHTSRRDETPSNTTASATQNATALTPAAWALAMAYRGVLARREAA